MSLSMDAVDGWHGAWEEAVQERDEARAEVERLRAALVEMLQAMQDYGLAVDEEAPYRHRAMMERACEALKPPQR